MWGSNFPTCALYPELILHFCDLTLTARVRMSPIEWHLFYPRPCAVVVCTTGLQAECPGGSSKNRLGRGE